MSRKLYVGNLSYQTEAAELQQLFEQALLCGYAFGHFYKETRDPRFEDVVAQHSQVMPAAQ